MKRLLASVALVVTLAACSQEAEAPAAPVEEVAAAPTVTKETYVGTWNVTRADGSTHVTTNNADGSFTRVMSDGTTDGGFWTFTAEQSCWTPEGGEATCYTIGAEDATGTLTLTATDGSIVTATRAAVAAEPAAEAPADAG